MKKIIFIAALTFALASLGFAQQKKSNILIIWGDDIGLFTIRASNMGMMEYNTPPSYRPLPFCFEAQLEARCKL